MPKVLLIGWDAADWKVIHPMMDRGEMPALQSLVEQGSMGNLTTIHPVLSPMLWTSIATGKRPSKHGIHGFTEPDPAGNAIRPVSSYSRRCKAVWNMLQHHDLRSTVLGWWPSHPAEPINGVMVSNHFHRAVDAIEQPWPLDDATFHPPRLKSQLADLRVHPQELTGEHLLPFIPNVLEMERQDDPRIRNLAKTLADCSTVQAVATSLIDSEPWDLMAVYFDAIDHFSHGFMKFHPPQQNGVSDDDFLLFKDVINGAYRFHDMMLQRLLASIDDDTTVVLISDHGFHPDHLRPQSVPREPAGPAIEHRDHGIFVAKGPGIRADHLIHGASVLDVTPTLLTLFGLPVGEDMDGEPLLDIFVDPVPKIKSIRSWEDVSGECGMHPVEKQLNPVEARQAIDQLVALGYISKPGDDVEEAICNTVRESRYNLAQSHMDAGEMGDAIDILEPLLEEWPSQHRFAIKLAACYQAMGRIADQRRVAESTLAKRQEESAAARKSLNALHESLKQRQKERNDTGAAAVNSTEMATEEGIDVFDASLLSLEELQQYQQLKSVSTYSPHFAHYLLATVCYAEEDYDEALVQLKKAESIQPDALGMLNMLGMVYLQLGRLKDADRNFGRVLDSDPNNAKAHFGKARLALKQGKFPEAIERCLTAVGLQYHFPAAHFALGEALHKSGDFAAAIDAFSVTLTQNPRSVQAHRGLASALAKQGNHAAANEHLLIADSIENQTFDSPVEEPSVPVTQAEVPSVSLPSLASDTIVVVSGLPRSGTSLLMQMLAAGGLTPLADDKREADDDNPRGYLEYEPVRDLRDDTSWIPSARGKVIKIVAPLLSHLPAEESYRVIFATRDLDEIIASQQKMLERRGTSGAALSAESLKKVFQRQLDSVKANLAKRSDVEVTFVDYAACVADPISTSNRINDFLGGSLDEQAMTVAVDPNLYRNRHQETLSKQ